MSEILKSAEINELAAALSLAQSEVKGPEKDSSNPFFKSKYADLASCWAAWQASGPKHGLSIVQLPSFEQNGDSTLLCVRTMLMHKSGQWLAADLSVPIVKRDPQGIGSAMTYARRYGLMAMVGLAPVDEDDDGNAASQPQKQQPQKQPAPQANPNPKANLEKAIADWKAYIDKQSDPTVLTSVWANLRNQPAEVHVPVIAYLCQRAVALGHKIDYAKMIIDVAAKAIADNHPTAAASPEVKSPSAEQFAVDMTSWNAKIDAITSPTTMTALIQEVIKLPNHLLQPVKKRMMDRSLQLGWTFDSASKSFTDPVVADNEPDLSDAPPPDESTF